MRPKTKELFQPVRVTAPRPDPAKPAEQWSALYVRSFLFMRTMIGVIGIALPLVLVFVDGGWFGGEPFPRDSLSAYYYSGVRDVFVGGLCATGVFLVAYKVFERNLDNTLSLVAGLAVLAVAFFPTGTPKHVRVLTDLQDQLGEGLVKGIHFTGAGVFILSLGALCICFGIREGVRPQDGARRSPRFWRTFHWTCAGVIGASVVFIVVAGIAGAPEKALLIGEWASVWAFGLSWLMKGLELNTLRGRPR